MSIKHVETLKDFSVGIACNVKDCLTVMQIKDIRPWLLFKTEWFLFWWIKSISMEVILLQPVPGLGGGMWRFPSGGTRIALAC